MGYDEGIEGGGEAEFDVPALSDGKNLSNAAYPQSNSEDARTI